MLTKKQVIYLNKRQLKILETISEQPKMNVSQLAEEFGVSQVTIRQDLKSLESSGMLKRFHGGAAIIGDDIMQRLSVNFDIKTAIAAKAASLVARGETVMIESGSTNALLAKKLTEIYGVQIITNSAFIARYIRDSQSRVTLLGGEYQTESEVMVGPLVKSCVEHFNLDKLFIGVDGFSPDIGFTCKDLMRGEAVKAMAMRTRKVIVLTDSSKFSSVGVVSMFKPQEVSLVITDSGIPEECSDSLTQNGVELLIV